MRDVLEQSGADVEMIIRGCQQGRDRRAADWRMKRAACRNWARQSWRDHLRIKALRAAAGLGNRHVLQDNFRRAQLIEQRRAGIMREER